MYFSEKEFESYAKLIVHLVAVDTTDFVLIHTDFEHKDLVTQLVKFAYQKGAQFVQILVNSEYLDGLRATHSEEQYLNVFPQSIIDLYKEYNDKRACIISIRSPEAPFVNKNVSTKKLAEINFRKREALSFFYKSVISDKFSWIVVAYPSVGWAKNIFPTLESKEGVQKLWNHMKTILRLDTSDPIQAWTIQQQKIIHRRTYLDNKKYNSLRFVSEGTDITVFLHEKSVWLGAAHKSANNKYFQANLPTEELYTSPDCRYTEGQVTIKRPLPIFGKNVGGIVMTFKEGKVIDAFAESGNDVLQQYLDASERNRYLGEIALVDITSFIWQSKLVFNNILFDENAGVHFALGAAYTAGYGFDSSKTPDNETLLGMGCNISKFHMDFVIGANDITVYGLYKDGSQEIIMTDGLFISELQ